MNDKPRINQGGEGYTYAPTRYRIFKEDQEDEWPWMLDGIDDDRNYTEDVRTFSTWQEAIDYLPEFAALNPIRSNLMDEIMTAEDFYLWMVDEVWIEACQTEEQNEPKDRKKAFYVADLITRLERIQNGEI